MPKILIVDDDAVNRLRLSRIAQSLGYSTVLASDGARALNVLEDNPDLDAVVTDCQMPNLDGPGLIQALRARSDTRLVLVFSAYRSVREVAALLEQGANGFLTYPVTREQLGEYLQRYLLEA
ncbi:MAG TPA: response regulator [Fibrobacteria bacterium]|nr:response regulator [Fibrobacteria bacterium]